MEPINLDEFEQAVKDKLPKMVYDYYAAGAHDEITLSENRNAYSRIMLKYRVLRDISSRSLETTILDQAVSMPIIIAPTAFHCLAHPDGELATVRAAGTAGVIMILSSLATTSIEDVVEASSGPVWFQLYVYKDRAATAALVDRAESAGCTAIVLTVDAQIWGRRECDVRNRFQLPEGLSVKNLQPAGKEQFPKEAADSGLAAYVTSLFDPALSWPDVEWLCSITTLPVFIKGVVHSEDARKALDYGVAGVIVSNHGGRQLDTAPATIDVLSQIVEAVENRLDVFVDGGIRRGTDVIKALALGADAVAIGRPIIWGLAHNGEKGVQQVLEIMRFELDLAMGLCGFSGIEEIRSDILHIG
jgi:4-hydroxymandelate oxidase